MTVNCYAKHETETLVISRNVDRAIVNDFADAFYSRKSVESWRYYCELSFENIFIYIIRAIWEIII